MTYKRSIIITARDNLEGAIRLFNSKGFCIFVKPMDMYYPFSEESTRLFFFILLKHLLRFDVTKNREEKKRRNFGFVWPAFNYLLETLPLDKEVEKEIRHSIIMFNRSIKEKQILAKNKILKELTEKGIIFSPDATEEEINIHLTKLGYPCLLFNTDFKI